MIDRRNREIWACVAQTYADHAAAPFPPIAGVERAPALEMDSLGETRAGIDVTGRFDIGLVGIGVMRLDLRSGDPRAFSLPSTLLESSALVIHGIGIHVVVEGGHLQDL